MRGVNFFAINTTCDFNDIVCCRIVQYVLDAFRCESGDD